MAVEARRLADELGLTGTHVFFNEEWVAYDQRQNFLLDADVGRDHPLPPRRDRLLVPHPGARLPVGHAADRDHRRRFAGRPHRAQGPRPHGAARGRRRAWPTRCSPCSTTRPGPRPCRENIREIVPELVWAEALRPLVEFCRAPRRAPDLMEGLVGDDHGPHPTELTPAPRGLRADVRLVVRYLREGGPRPARAQGPRPRHPPPPVLTPNVLSCRRRDGRVRR